MLPSIFGENLFDELFDFPALRELRNIDRKLYGRRAAHEMKTDVREHEDHHDHDEHEHDHDEHEHDHDEHEHHHHHHHHADDVFTSWGRETAKTFTEDEIREDLKALDNALEYGIILRAKGIVPAVDGRWIHFDHVPGEIDVRYGAADVIGKLCVIGSKINEQALKELFKIG